MKYFMFFLTLVLPIALIYYSCKFLDQKNKEPKRAILLALVFGVFIFFIEFFLTKPAIGKILGYVDTYLFAYFITEEKEQLASLSPAQNLLVILLASLSKAITYGIGIKVLFTWLYRLGKKSFFSGKHVSVHGFLDEPIDYFVYSACFFIMIALLDNLVHFRLDSGLGHDKFVAFYFLFSYIILSLLIGFLWLKKKMLFSGSSAAKNSLSFIPDALFPKTKNRFASFISPNELLSIILIFFYQILLKTSLFISSPALIIFVLCLNAGLLFFLFKKIKNIRAVDYELVDAQKG